MSPACPLCDGPARPFPTGMPRVHGRRFLACDGISRCGLVFVAREDLPDRESESLRYRHHRNDSRDEGYRRFLSQLVDSLTPDLRPGARGLDYGCGPQPVLATLLIERGFSCESYDPLFYPQGPLLDARYDFVTVSEVAEHFHEPLAELERLATLLVPGATLAVRTQPLVDEARFAEWHYVRDLTHVAFYSPRTFQWIAERFGWKLAQPRTDVALFTSSKGDSP